MSRYIACPDFPSFLSFRTKTIEITRHNITFCICYKYFFRLRVHSHPIRNCYFRLCSSHGGTLGLIIALWLYCRKTKLHYMDVLDMIAVATPITACFIRLANLMNSEIIGKPSDVPWAFVFERVDMLPRHPGQLYEAIAYLILFFIMIYLYKNYSKKLHRGFFFGLCLTYIFTFRFFIEFLKENQEDFENSMMFNMGQWLSVPFIIIGVYFMFFYDKKKNKIA